MLLRCCSDGHQCEEEAIGTASQPVYPLCVGVLTPPVRSAAIPTVCVKRAGAENRTRQPGHDFIRLQQVCTESPAI